MSAADKEAAKAAIVDYVEVYGPDVSMVDLRGFVRHETGIDFGGPTLAAFLKPLGYRRDTYRRIDTCPGKSLFYVRAD